MDCQRFGPYPVDSDMHSILQSADRNISSVTVDDVFNSCLNLLHNILKTTECRKCRIFRPSRSHHCSLCKTCIDKLDHHCYFLNNCVGTKNYKFFLSYLFLSMINSLYMLILGIYQFYSFNIFKFLIIIK